MHATMADMGTHAAPSLRLAGTPDRITVLAGAMRELVRNPGEPASRKGIDAAMRGCTDEEYEAAWELAQRAAAAVTLTAEPEPEHVTEPEPEPAAEAPPSYAPPAAPRALTRGQRILAGFAAVLGLGLTPMFFIVMFMTVNELLGQYFDGWAWTVPVATETTFVLLTVLAILFEWMRRPVPALWKLPYLFAALSLFMNVWAYRDSPPGIAGHLAVTAAFFIPMSFAKTTVRKLIVTPAERARAASLADARAHACDVLRAAFGVLWRYRTPVLLRRQLKSGRLPAAVAAAVETCDAAAWEPVVQAWITAAVTLPSQVGKALRAASAAAALTDSGQDNGADRSPDNGPDKSRDRLADSVTDSVTDKAPDNGPGNSGDTSADKVTDISPDKRGTRTASRAAKTAKPVHPVAAMIKRRPTWDDERIATECDVHPKTVKRHREALEAAAKGA